MRNLFVAAAFLILLLASCLKEKTFPVEPFIEFKSFTKITIPPDTIPESLMMSLRFTDGDGDIGLYDDEKDPPYDYNLFIDIYRRVMGVHEKIIFPDTTLTFNSRIPVVTGNENGKAIEGVIEYTFDYKLLRTFLLGDTVAFDVSIKDRALNRSNIVRTPDIIIE